MTIEEYLKSEIEYSKGMMFEADDIEGKSYFEGKADALDELLRKLPEMEHEVTLREALEMCQSRFEEGCGKCSLNPDCCIYMNPTLWNIDEIEKRMKEARND